MKVLQAKISTEIRRQEEDFDKIDDIIRANIDRATAENSSVWTCPDYNKREYIHSFFQYPARMIPAVQKKLIEIVLEANPGIQNMIDPFMGSATTLVACMESGLNCYGQDINPLSILIAKTRTGPYYIEALKEKYEELLNRISADNSNEIEVNFPGINKWFKKKISIELSKIVRSVRAESRPAIRRFFWVVLAEAVRLSSNDRTSTYKLHMRPISEIRKRNFSAIDVFTLHMDQSIEDFELHANLLKKSLQLSNGSYKGHLELRLLDSKEDIFSPIDGSPYDLLVTSPPYGDNKTTVTYGQNSYLPLQWIDLDDIDLKASKDCLVSTSEIDTRSLGGRLKKIDECTLQQIFEKSPVLKATYQSIKNKSKKDVKKVGAFMIDLDKTLDNIFKVMAANSYQIWTVGNRKVAKIEIPNDQIITELIESKGGKLVKQVEREIINKRMAKRNKDTSLMNTEDILIFRKVGTRN